MSRSQEDDDYRGSIISFHPSREDAILRAHQEEKKIAIVEYGVLLFESPVKKSAAEQGKG